MGVAAGAEELDELQRNREELNELLGATGLTWFWTKYMMSLYSFLMWANSDMSMLLFLLSLSLSSDSAANEVVVPLL